MRELNNETASELAVQTPVGWCRPVSAGDGAKRKDARLASLTLTTVSAVTDSDTDLHDMPLAQIMGRFEFKE